MFPQQPWSQTFSETLFAPYGATAKHWLQESGSMTKRLRSQWSNLTVQVLQEGLMLAQSDEYERLSISPQTLCWVREVQLQEESLHLVHARTIIPHWNEQNPWRQVSTLGSRPLGEILFTLPNLQRSEFFYAITQSQKEGQSDTFLSPARSCIFVKEGAPLLLTESIDLLVTNVLCTA